MAPNQAPLSKSWSDRYEAVPFSRVDSNKWYGVPDKDDEAAAQRAKAKAEFIASDTLEAPDLNFPKLHEIDFPGTEREFQELLVDAMSLPEKDIDARYEQAARKLAELYRHKEVVRGLGLAADRLSVSRERAGVMTQELFGSPKKEAFIPMVGELRKQAELLQDTTPLAAELLSLLGNPENRDHVENIELQDTTITTIRGDLEALFPGIIEWSSGDIQEKPGIESVMKQWESLLELTGKKSQGWRFRTVPGSVAADTDKHAKKITIGEERVAEMTRGQLIKTGIHEVLGHAGRKNIGLNNLAFEEGLGVALEQIISGEKRTPGKQYYTSLALQLGLDRGGEQRNFREVYEILWRRIVVEAEVNGTQVTIEDAKSRAYTQCMRTRRGGALDARDISYSEGAQKANPWLNELAEMPTDRRREILRKALSISYDLTDENQVLKAEEV